MADDPMAQPVAVRRLRLGAGTESANDMVAVESPLEVRVEGKSVAVIMRTPRHDRELAAGFLLTEGIVAKPSDIFEISLCPGATEGNAVDVVLRNPERFDLGKLTRHVFTSSSCGICGKATVESALTQFPPIPPGGGSISLERLTRMAEDQRAAQATFTTTGGLHASAIFDLEGRLLLLREDVGRHNALDKVLGAALLAGQLPLNQHVLLLSGRISFELMQKALAAGVPIVAAVGAPSSLAVDFARNSGQTLAGFLRDGRCNVYAGVERITSINSS